MSRYLLKPHQVRVIDFALKNPYSIISVAMGGGKTLIALDIYKKVGGTMLVVVPSYLINNWIAEIKKFLGNDTIITAITSGKNIYDLWDTDIAIISYDLVQKSKFFEWADTVVIDEAHHIKSMKARVTDFIHRNVYENSKKRVHLLTGTPIKNRVEEFYSLIALCNYNPKLAITPFLNKFEDSVTFADYFSNRREYDIPVKNRFVRVVKWEGYKNVEELKGYLKDIYIRVESEEFLSIEKPYYRDVLISKEENPELGAAFEYFQETESVAPAAKVASAVLKVPTTVKYVKNLALEVGKVVVYTDHREPCWAIAKALGVTSITGDTSKAERHRISEEFQHGDLQFIVATIKSFSTGVNLTAANNMVFNDVSWSPGDMDQAECRIARIGQTKPCTIHRILGSPQDEKILAAIEGKRNTIRVVV